MQLADTLGGRVVGPDGLTLRLGTACHAPEGVILHGCGLALGVGLAGEFAEGVVRVGPVPHAGVLHGGLATPYVVPERGGDDLGVGVVVLVGFEQVAEGVVVVAELTALFFFDEGDLA